MQLHHCYVAAAVLGITLLTPGCDEPTALPTKILPSPGPTETKLGELKITATTVGVDIDPAGYGVEVRFETSVSGGQIRVPTNGTVAVSTQPGTYILTVFGLAPNCEPAIPNPRTVVIVSGTSTPVALDVKCVTPTQIAFVNGAGSEAEIYVANSNGTGASRLTTQPGADVNPAWSPDGSRIAFASERDGNFEIYVMSANGANPVRLTNVPAADYRPAWSPDGSRIAFVSERDGNAEIYVMNADGTSPVRLTTDDGKDGDPAWSPDGSSIAFSTDRDGNAEIYVMAANGSHPSRLTVNDQPDVQPVWSPDGTRIAFSRGQSLENPQIYIMKADGSDVTRLSQFVASGSDPAWSPDGNKIAFASLYCDFYYHDPCEPILYVVRTDGTPYILLALQSPSEPTWRP